MISPEFFTSGTMNALNVQTMITFAGVWCWADDFGRGEDDETLVKAAVWPRRRLVTERKVRSDMDELCAVGVLCRYVVNGQSLVHVVNWPEHQSISHPTKSKLVPCKHHEPEAWEIFLLNDDPVLAKFRPGSGAAPEFSRR